MFASTSRLPLQLARIAPRDFSSSARKLAKTPLGPTSTVANPADLHVLIGRGAEKRLATQAESWEKLNEAWMKGGEGLKSSGLSVRDRRYVLWAFSRYAQGDAPQDFLSGPRIAKKYRGWGPRVQHGVRIK